MRVRSSTGRRRKCEVGGGKGLVGLGGLAAVVGSWGGSADGGGENVGASGLVGVLVSAGGL